VQRSWVRHPQHCKEKQEKGKERKRKRRRKGGRKGGKNT
jgi:hypothetical protein